MFSPEIIGNAIIALFSILNPITVVPMYADLTRTLDAKSRNRLFDTAAVAAFLTLLVLTFTGRWIMEFVFQINVAEFRIAGGIILIVIAIRQIAFYKPEEPHTDPERTMEMGVVPMAVPMLVGPGAIVTSILILDRDGWIISLIALGVNFVVSWAIIRLSPTLSRIMGKFGTLVVARILWIFIGAIAVNFLVNGISTVFGLTLPTLDL